MNWRRARIRAEQLTATVLAIRTSGGTVVSSRPASGWVLLIWTTPTSPLGDPRVGLLVA